MTWQETTFQDLYRENSRNGIYKPKKFHGSGAKIVNMGELFAYRSIGPQEMARLEVDDSELDRFSLTDGDLLFARRSLVESGAGKCVLVADVVEPTVFESSLIRARLDPQLCDPRFYFYYFGGHPGRGRIEAIITGVAQKGIRGSELAKISVHAPPLDVQCRIADILSAYDDLIENNNRRMALLEESIHLLYREWFVYLRFPGHERVEVVEGVPEGWTRVRLEGLVDQVRKRIHPSQVDPATPYVGLEHIPRRCIALSEWGEAADVASNKFRFTEGDVLFGKIRPYFHKVVFAPTSGICSSDTIVMRPRAPDLFGLALAVTSSARFVDHVWQTAKIGAKMPRANWKVMAAYPVLQPTPVLHAEFSDFVGSTVTQIQALLGMNRKLREARDLLLPRLMDRRIPV